MKSHTKTRSSNFSIFKLIICFCLLFSSAIYPQTLIVDFGSSSGANIFGLGSWNTVLLGANQGYSSAGPDGTVPTANFCEYGDFQGVQGPVRTFETGERIVATWYNNSDHEIRFIVRISFDDPDYPDSGTVTGTWFSMRSYDNFRYAFVTAQAYDTVKTVFNFFDAGVHAAAGDHSIINLNLSIEWGQNDEKQYIICDKIEMFFDADTTPPNQPTNLSAIPISDSKIRLTWNAGVDNVGVYEYYVYLNGVVESQTFTNSDTIHLLHPSTNYTFTVSALDVIGNESIQSATANASTLTFQGGSNLINPDAITYLGAFRVPEEMAYGGDAITYNPNGDPGGGTDGYPGSLFASGYDIPESSRVCELRIPAPIISPTKNHNELNQATLLQSFTNIRPDSVTNALEFVDLWRLGLEYMGPRGGQTSPKLYHSWGIYYDASATKIASLCWCDLTDLSNTSQWAGPWYIGTNSEPLDCKLNDYLFSIPQSWADSYTSGRSLITGKMREGGLSGLGPTLYAVAPWAYGNPPAVNTQLAYTVLLQYGSVENATDYYFPNSFVDYNHADYWKSADWISAASKSAFMIIGLNGFGDNWYGYWGEKQKHEWVQCNIPYPDFPITDPNGKGWRANTLLPMMVFYDPADIQAVAQGTMQPYEPQPYAALRIDPNIFYGNNCLIYSATFDSANGFLYVTEREAIQEDGNCLIHIWKINEFTDIDGRSNSPFEFKLEQNYPNPFNPATTIEYCIPSNVKGQTSSVILKVYDILGQEVATLVNEQKSPGVYKVSFDATNLSSGVYIYRLHTGDLISSKKMIVLK